MLTCWRARPVFPHGRTDFRRGLCCKAEEQALLLTERQSKKKVVVVGSGWAGLGAAHHLCKQVLIYFFGCQILSLSLSVILNELKIYMLLEFGFRDLMSQFLKVDMNLDGKLSLLLLMMPVFEVIYYDFEI